MTKEAPEPTNAFASMIGGKLFNWAVGAIGGILVVLTFGDRLYATKEDLNNVKTEVQSVRIYLEIQGKQISEMKQDQAVAFGKMETSIKGVEQILTSQRSK